jgi:hypothetical protein
MLLVLMYVWGVYGLGFSVFRGAYPRLSYKQKKAGQDEGMEGQAVPMEFCEDS